MRWHLIGGITGGLVALAIGSHLGLSYVLGVGAQLPCPEPPQALGTLAPGVEPLRPSPSAPVREASSPSKPEHWNESRPGPRFGNDSAGAPDGVLRVGGAVTRPVLIRDGTPRYAESLDRAVTIRGPVVIEAIIDEEGRISDARYLKGGDHPGAAAALDVVRGRRYRPAMLDGKPVAVYMVTTTHIHYW